ncbi:MAG: hypothetical protein E6Q97_29520 [Desulfurellales bacterium]|nr:MAG: hypothetical protein E6Q97_29520 [Desulfurellales bacterium]
MQIIRQTLERMTIESFADQHGLKMLVKEAFLGGHARFLACFAGEVQILSCPPEHAGQGDTEEEAIQDYAEQISGKILVIDPNGGVNRKNFKIPILHYGAAAIQKLRAKQPSDPRKPMLNG